MALRIGAIAAVTEALELFDALVRAAHPRFCPVLAVAGGRDRRAEAGLRRLDSERIERDGDEQGEEDRHEPCRHATGDVRSAWVLHRLPSRLTRHVAHAR